MGTPYHRTEQSIRDVYRIFSASNNAQSKRLLDARGVELVLICPSPRGTRTLYELTSERGTFYSRLRNAQVPYWMRPVSLPADTGGFRLFDVIR